MGRSRYRWSWHAMRYDGSGNEWRAVVRGGRKRKGWLDLLVLGQPSLEVLDLAPEPLGVVAGELDLRVFRVERALERVEVFYWFRSALARWC